METGYYHSPAGTWEINAHQGAVTKIALCEAGKTDAESSNDPVIQQAIRQLSEYFAGKRQSFELPLSISGTAFQEKVWDALQQIPYGETISYAQLAQAVGNPKACRAVGSANGKNPIAIVIPCHRVIASDGTLGGYAYGLDIKKDLLGIEKDKEDSHFR
ncbi:MAG: methylated-DNA--[protein]-cysteine S-methyltransferase [Candidatus Symbiothrix sp.]|jgi:methylated-DNA-[protein]-cysteine S-methyltransferase|nr:methylated-DNA--[protein]-cysteine S-methyltransferase [Candidatus Symbiothrix sp.]